MNVEALKELAEKVEAGETGKQICRSLIWSSFGRDFRVAGDPIGRIFDYILDPEDIRAMGAAKSLHEALLPGWRWEGGAGGLFAVWDDPAEPYKGRSDIPARAWLLAILRALIAEAQQ